VNARGLSDAVFLVDVDSTLLDADVLACVVDRI
jgi:hypothetical protein